jgi:hypothetical protein
MTRPRRNGKNTERAIVEIAGNRFREDFGMMPYSGGVVDGIAWLTCLAPTWGLNGYVLIPAEGHPWSRGWPMPQTISKDDWYDDDLDKLLEVHGGVTFRNHPWVGFDTAHAGDRWPKEFDSMGLSSISGMGPWSRDWTPELVEREAQKLARQIAAYGKAEGNSVDSWTRGMNVELSDEFTQMRRVSNGARDSAEAMKRLTKMATELNKTLDDLGLSSPTAPPLTGRFAHLDIPSVQEMNTNPPPTP